MKSKTILLSTLYSLVGLLILMQTNVIPILASSENNPITAAITNFINEVNATNITNTSPITDPTPTSDPVTSPITDPTPQPTATPASAQSQSGSSNNDSSSGSGNSQAPVCGDSRPVSAPKLLSATKSGKNEVTLAWSKALDPVSYYLIAYGTKPGVLEYGNPNAGDKNTTRYTVKRLSSDKTYYFKVRAGNGCMPGEFSNEIAAKPSGRKINEPASGFKAGVLGSTKQDAKIKQDIKTKQDAPFKPITAVEPTRITESSVGFFTKVLNFLGSIFKR